MINEEKRLHTLKTIAELLNQSQDREEMLSKVLAEFIGITHFEAGWIFIEENESVRLATSYSLPPALERNDQEPMCGEDCYCIQRYNQRKLNKATSIIGCKRIEKSISAGQSDTNGITHHATVPLKTPSNYFGLLNVAAPNKLSYDQAELDLLEAIALQIGSAIDRISKYESEKKRVRLLTNLHQFNQRLQQVTTFEAFHHVLSNFSDVIPYDRLLTTSKGFSKTDGHVLSGEYGGNQHLTIVRKTPFLLVEKDCFRLILDYLDVVYLQLTLMEKEKELIKVQERSHLAQDLHDSVSQLLFSVVLTSKALESSTKEHTLKEQIKYIHTISSQALSEMRTLIARHKSEGLEMGIIHGLKAYGETLGLTMECTSDGTVTLPYAIEENLWRIGQEALHNIRKHADTEDVFLELRRKKDAIHMKVKDYGKGFTCNNNYEDLASFGLKGMKERTEMFNGTFEITSEIGKGTVIHVSIPLGV
ncbi:GAF domain-containing sensor histidine kinase [Aquibacillus albus]|uniref:histidine kinase n=1 Tax=Aquibacillus albus TaxID=1168171 RepID=A0ABS2N0E0_9BACI|nr:GAF domain-containing sensor histidine kinase [Aquibacillus albus]MBM7571611.1 signal transduction histidine kinase [Aquibacillus albus]